METLLEKQLRLTQACKTGSGNFVKGVTLSGGEHLKGRKIDIREELYKSLGFGVRNEKFGLFLGATDCLRYCDGVEAAYCSSAAEKTELHLSALVYHLRLLELQLAELLRESCNDSPKLAALNMQALELRRMACAISKEVLSGFADYAAALDSLTEAYIAGAKPHEKTPAKPEQEWATDCDNNAGNDVSPIHENIVTD